MAKKYNDRISRTDEFWDIDGMLPAKIKTASFTKDTGTVEIKVSDGGEGCAGEKIPARSPEQIRLEAARTALREATAKISAASAAARGDRDIKDFGFTLTENADEPLLSYTPENNPLIKSVKIKKWPSRYSFYERFRHDAGRLFKKSGQKCEYVSFFSYTPQYVQMSGEQLEYYLYWRGCVREDSFVKADFSHILLYIYEIINLPDKIKAADGVILLCKIWNAYRGQYPKLDKYMSEWLCDYCLINQTEPPRKYYDGFFDSVTSNVSFKEFYIGYDDASPSPYASAMFAYGSNYNWRGSKFITPQNRPLFEKHIRGAFLYAFSKAEHNHQTVFAPIGKSGVVNARIVRDAYSGALCAYDVKRRIELEYISCSRSTELRYAVTDMIKYAENNVRGMLGIRSRFHTPNLATPLKNAADEYFAPFRKKMKKTEEGDAPALEYEKYYEAERSDFSADFAKNIEKKSWETTSLLVDALDGEERFAECVPAAAVIREEPLDLLKAALGFVMNCNMTGLAEIAKTNNMMTVTLIEKLNETLYDLLGDVAVTEESGGYGLVEEYRGELEEWMKM